VRGQKWPVLLEGNPKEGGIKMIKFDDGVQFDTRGPLRVVKRRDGYYVVGEGLLIPVDSREEGEQVKKELKIK